MTVLPYEYVVTYWPTHINEPDWKAARGDGALQVSFETVEDAVDHAVDNEWWPFIVERIKRG